MANSPKVLRVGGGFIMITDDLPQSESMLARAGVHRGSYAYDFADRMICSFLNGLSDLADEYKEFFHPEYKTFLEFLVERYDLKEELAKLMVNAFDDNQRVYHGYFSENGDYNMMQWLESDAGWRSLRALISFEEVQDEDEERFRNE